MGLCQRLACPAHLSSILCISLYLLMYIGLFSTIDFCEYSSCSFPFLLSIVPLILQFQEVQVDWQNQASDVTP